ncbi:neurofascin-like [Pomacea canaliculata]|uniref:neurofascin-like n=1 Tax=Pomacea canaliculata TaxID=400727 RepID=UPI000D73FF77|nr:neurofascin-like [Pomacea canaliculata]XP_025090624.1 neurofascin-like [Pomacea canaliculata]XP_025090625.1 neurofascin-like [Pomacea canaliculata]
MAWIASTTLPLLLTVLGTLSLLDAEEIRIPPSITSPVERQVLSYSENDLVEVRCIATGQPAPSYKWTWNGNDINSDYITFSAATGILTIPKLSIREEGLFVCYAKSTFSNGMTATAVSATVEIRVGRVEDFQKRPLENYFGTLGNYATIPCDKNLPKYYGAITFKWYTVLGSRNDEVFPDERKLIDQGGNLHFSYVLDTDARGAATPYKCAISSTKANVIRLGNENSLTVTGTGPIPNSAPKLQYSTSGSFLTVEIGKNATLECVFSGYISSSIPSETVPRVTWFDQDGRAITQGGRYDITSNGRILTIMNVTEDDEKTYRCRGSNSMSNDEGSLALNVTSQPIWVQRLESTTVVEGKDAVFQCVTRSAKGEQSPSQPKWSLNTDQMGSTYDPNKYQFNADKTKLTVKFVNKDKDIACFQCTVANSVGMVHDDGCVNVIKPIEIKVRPAAEQSVNKGEEVDLTVVASTDPLYAPEMTYSWIFKNVTYTGDKVPPHVSYDSVNNRAYINTSGLTDEEFKSIGGLYRRVISHPVETVYVDVSVETEHVPVVPAVATASFDYWIIGLIIGIIIIIIVILLIICVICRRKMLEGTYPVDKKETAAGLDPEKELKDSGFHDLSRADYDEYPEKKPPRDLEFDDIPIGEGDDESFSEYGEEPSNFNEDGSFIGVYSKDTKKPPRQPNPTESNV